jgi:hypothetical protein
MEYALPNDCTLLHTHEHESTLMISIQIPNFRNNAPDGTLCSSTIAQGFGNEASIRRSATSMCVIHRMGFLLDDRYNGYNKLHGTGQDRRKGLMMSMAVARRTTLVKGWNINTEKLFPT